MSVLAQYRKDLHQIPELGFEEFKTQAYVLEIVNQLDCQVLTVQTGVILHFDLGHERTIGFRADMDGLPVTEATGADYASVHEGRMHACGHDGHMAIMLGFAQWVNEHRLELDKNIVILFQPSEEKEAGARQIIASGILQQLRVDCMFGLHLWPGLPLGTVASRPGEFMASTAEVDVYIKGKSVHVADSHLGINALQAGVEFLTGAYELESRLDEHIRRLLAFGQMEAGTVRNVVAGDAHIYGTLRSYDEQVHGFLANGLEEIAKELEHKYGCDVKLTFNGGYDAVINDEALFGQLLAGGLQIQLLEEPVMQGEDFGCYRQLCPTVFFHLGVGDVAPLHNEKFDFDMAVLEDGVQLFIDVLKAL